MNRRRGTASLPEELRAHEKLSNKKEMTIKGQRPSCPVPLKVRRNLRSQNGTKKPTPLCFNNNVCLSPMYDPQQDICYLDQVFTNFGILGEGSFGKVFRVRSKEDRKLYAVKHLKSNVSAKDRIAEVKNNEFIGYNDNCVRYFMSWEENYDTFLLFEYCEMSLQDYSKLNRDVPEDLLWNVLYDICNALNYLHKKNFIHLDVKPGNVMMRKGQFKLGDFGLLVDMQKKNHVRKSTLSDGDSKYLALEVLNGIYTAACDIFGLGISILELATDIELPDHGMLWHKLRRERLPHWFYQRVTYRLSLIIERMIKSNYQERPAAEKILTYGSLKDIAKRDKKKERVDFAAPFVKPDESYEALPLPLSPISFNNNDNVTTPPFNNNLKHSLLDVDYDSNYDTRGSDENSIKFSGRKSLFSSSMDENVPCHSHSKSVPMEEDADSDHSSLAHCLCDSGMESDNLHVSATQNEKGDPFKMGSLITSTPVLPKTKHMKRIPKTKLSFD